MFLHHLVSFSWLKNKSFIFNTLNFQESLNGYKFLKLKGKDLNLLQDVLRNSLASKSIRVESHVSFLAGIRIVEENTDPDMFSGYQVMRLATELIPSIVSLLGIYYKSYFEWIDTNVFIFKDQKYFLLAGLYFFTSPQSSWVLANN